MTNETRNTDDIERDIKGTRARLDSTLGALQNRISVGNLVDEAVAFFGGTPKDTAAAVGREVRANPVPIALAAGGIAWYLVGRNKPAQTGHEYGTGATADDVSDEDRITLLRLRSIERTRALTVRGTDEAEPAYKHRLYSAYGDTLEVKRAETDTDESYLDKVKDAITSLSEKTSDAAQRLTAKASAAGASVREHASSAAAATADAGHRAREAAGRAGETATARMTAAGQGARRTTRAASEGTAAFYDNNPLVSGLLAVAAGAVIGSLFAPTRVERKYGGPLVDDVAAAAANLAEDAEGMVKDTAGKVQTKVKETADEHGVGSTHAAATTNGSEASQPASLN